MKYLRFQMSTLVAYIAIFLAAGALDIAGGVPLNPLQILWLNMVVDIPIAIALGFDEPTKGLMKRAPRPVGAPVLSRNDWVRLCIQGAVMTVGALVAYQIGNDQDGALVASTMLLTTLSLFHVVAGLLSRDQLQHHLRPRRHPGGRPAAPLRDLALIAIVAITGLDILQRIFDTTALTFDQWLICIGLALTLLVVEELIKARPAPTRPPADAAPSVSPWPHDPWPDLVKEYTDMSFNLRNRSFLKELDFTPAELKFLLKLSADLKAAKYGGYERAAPGRQEHRADLREDLDPDALRRSRWPRRTRARTSPTSSPAARRSATRSR